jgi:hypothetical protein
MYPVKKGATDQTMYFTLRDSTNHLPKTDVTITDIDLYYVTHKAAISTKADATALAAADSAHADNKAFHVGYGVYRIDWPDVWTGNVGETVQLIVVCTGVDTTFLECMLSPPVDVISIGGTVQTANDNGADINDILTDTGTTLDGKLDTIAGDTTTDIPALIDALPTAAEIKTAIEAAGGHLALILEDTGTTLDTKLNTIDDFLDTEIAAILSDTNELQTDWANGGRLDLILDAASAPTASQVADAVWDEAISGHLGAGSTGNALNAAGSAGDPWATPIPGAYGAGTAGKILGDNINAPIATVDTVVDAIKVVVDNIHDTDLPAVKTETAAILVDTGTTLDALIQDIPTVAEFNARSLPSADYTIVSDLGVVQTADHTAAIADIPTVAEFNARSTTDPATQTLLGTVAGYLDTEIAAIKAKTDNLPTDPADQSAVEAAITAATSPLATAANLATVDTVVDAVKVQTDKLTFTVANQIDANVQSINDKALTGDGSTGTPWGPV